MIMSRKEEMIHCAVNGENSNHALKMKLWRRRWSLMFVYRLKYIMLQYVKRGLTEMRTIIAQTGPLSLASAHVFIFMERYITSKLLTSRHFITCP